MRPSYDAVIGPNLQLLKRWVGKKGLTVEDADDVVQETLLLALRHFDQFRFEANFATWLCRIAINVIRGRMRRPGYSRTVLVDSWTLETMGLPDSTQCALTGLVKDEASKRLRRAVSQLPADYRAVVELRDLRGLSIRETAEFLALTRPAVKSRHHRARRQLHALMHAG
jgi:RNA polymerase sigma-70 factor (ECF subfamily)